MRPIKPAELLEAARIQFEGFYESVPLAGPLNAIFKLSFRGEVISGLQNKMRYEVGDRCVDEVYILGI